jgi:hypothetical protein
MWQSVVSSPMFLPMLVMFVAGTLAWSIQFIDIWRVDPRTLTPADKVNGNYPVVFEGLGSRLLIYAGTDWGLLIIEHYGLWRRWHGATGRQKMRLTLASRLVPVWGVLPGLICLERAKDQGRWGNLGEVNAIFFSRRQQPDFEKAMVLIHEINTKFDRKEPVRIDALLGGDKIEDEAD